MQWTGNDIGEQHHGYNQRKTRNINEVLWEEHTES